MFKRILIMLGAMLLFIAAIGFWKVRQIQAGIEQGKKFAPAPAAVTTVVAKAQTWQPTLEAVGSLKAVHGVVVSTDLAGIVTEIAVQSGAPVRKGDLLIRLDTRQEQAQLRSAEARRDLAGLNLNRQKELVGSKAVSQSEYDTAASEFRQAEAVVEEARALMARKTIVAPFDGMAGIRQVNVGQYLNVGDPVISLQSLDPIYVNFAVPQQSLGQLATGGKLTIEASGVSGARFEGEITAIDSRVDEATRNVLVQGTVRNPQGTLRPGMFVDAEVLLPEKDGVIAIPASSVSYAPYGNSVFVVKAAGSAEAPSDRKVEQHFVKLGPSRGDQVSVESGVRDGDEVVTSGAFKLVSGDAVRVDNSVRPANDPNPRPPEN